MSFVFGDFKRNGRTKNIAIKANRIAIVLTGTSLILSQVKEELEVVGS